MVLGTVRSLRAESGGGEELGDRLVMSARGAVRRVEVHMFKAGPGLTAQSHHLFSVADPDW